MPRSFKLLGWHISAYVDKGGSLTVHRLDAFKAGRSIHLTYANGDQVQDPLPSGTGITG